MWSFSIYCETEEQTKKDHLPKSERIPVPAIETTETGRMRSNNDIALHPMPHVRPGAATTRPRGDPRSGSDRDLQTLQVQNPMSMTGRRVAPTNAVDDVHP